MAYQRIKKLWPNSIPNVMPNHLARGLPKDYQEANGYSTEAAYRDTHQEVDQEDYREVDWQSLPIRPRFAETSAVLESASARRLSSGRRTRGKRSQEKIRGERSQDKITGEDMGKRIHQSHVPNAPPR